MIFWIVLLVAVALVVATVQAIPHGDPSRLIVFALVAWAVAIVFLVGATAIDCPDGSCHGDYLWREIVRTALAVVGIAHVVIGATLAAFARLAARRHGRATAQDPVDPGSPQQPS